MSITLVREFVGYYSSCGPKGYVEAASREEALELAQLVAEPWDDIVIGEPYQRRFDPRDVYYVTIAPK